MVMHGLIKSKYLITWLIKYLLKLLWGNGSSRGRGDCGQDILNKRRINEKKTVDEIK